MKRNKMKLLYFVSLSLRYGNNHAGKFTASPLFLPGEQDSTDIFRPGSNEKIINILRIAAGGDPDDHIVFSSHCPEYAENPGMEHSIGIHCTYSCNSAIVGGM